MHGTRMSKPLLTVAVTAYNYARYLPVCIESILGQDFTDFELIILDNCSTDNTREIVMGYMEKDSRIQYIRHDQNVGLLINFNYSCKVGTGKYYSIISADDFILPNHFSCLMGLLLENPHCPLAYSRISQVDQDGKIIGEPGHAGNTSQSYIGGRDEEVQLLLHGVYSCLPSIIFNREMIGDDLHFDFDTWGACDWDLAVRIARKYPDFIYDNSIAVCYRRHSDQYTSTTFCPSPEPLYGHMFMLEQALASMPPQKIAQYGPQFAGLLRRWSMQFGLNELDKTQQARLAHILTYLENGSDPESPPIHTGRVSVILPFPLLTSSIGEVLNGLRHQNHGDWECVITYPASAISEAQLIQHIKADDVNRRLVLLSHDNEDLAELLNAGMRHCTGDTILVLDRPVVLSANAMQRILSQLHSPEADIISIEETLTYPAPQTVPSKMLGSSNPVQLVAAWRRKVFNIAGGFNPGVGNPIVMHDFWTHAMKRGMRIVSLTGVAVSSGTSTLPPPSDIDRARMLFANPECATAPELQEAALYLLRHVHEWIDANNAALTRNPANSTAFWLRSMALPVLPKKPAESTKAHMLASQSYTRWVVNERPSPREAALLREIAVHRSPVRVAAVVLTAGVPIDLLQRTLRSLLTQLQPFERIILLGGQPRSDMQYPSMSWLQISGPWQTALNEVMAQLSEDWIYLIHGGDSLEPTACSLIADTSSTQPTVAFIYADEDLMMPDGTVQDYTFKPALNLDLLRSAPYIGRNIAFRRQAALDVGGLASHVDAAAGVDLLLRIIETMNFDAVGHIDHVLSHQSTAMAQWRSQSDVTSGMATAVREHLQRLGVRAQVLPTGDGMQRVAYQHDGIPEISVIVRSTSSLHSLKACLSSLLEKTSYPKMQVVVIEPSQTHLQSQEIKLWLARLSHTEHRVRTVPTDASGNVAASLNQAAAASTGDYLLFLDDSTRIMHGQWLEIMQSYAQRQEVGIVGPKLIDSNGKIVSAGVIMGLDGATGDAFAGELFQDSGYLGRLQADQNYSAVRGTCMMLNRRMFQTLGGFDQTYCAASHDIDLCLRAKTNGYLCVWTPHTVVACAPEALQHAGAIRQAVDDRARLLRTWWQWIGRDTAYNRNQSLNGSGFSIETRHEMTSPLPLREDTKSVVAVHFDDVAPAAIMDALNALGSTADADVIHLPALPKSYELAKLAPQLLLLSGIPSHADADALHELRTVSPLKIAYYVQHPPAKQKQELFEAVCALADRLILADASLERLCPTYQGEMAIIEESLPIQPWNHIQRSGLPQKKLRVGLPGDLDTQSWSILLPTLRSLANQIELVVYSRLYPLPLQNLQFDYHQLSPLQADKAAFLSGLNLDVALLPSGPGQQKNRRSDILQLGACGTVVIVGSNVTGAGDLPVRTAELSEEGWSAQIHYYLAQAERAQADGQSLRQAVINGAILNQDALQQWRDALWTVASA
jgi:glycosyltransferase involved in cell wall biosynthesis